MFGRMTKSSLQYTGNQNGPIREGTKISKS